MPATHAIISSLRPGQWWKNIFVFAALVFSGRASDARQTGISLFVFVLFCILSSSGYLFNDLLDKKRDEKHPKKKARPIAAGHISAPVALGLMGFLAGIGLVGGFLVGISVGSTLLFYLALSISYSLIFKRVLILDVIVLALGYVLRIMVGAFSIAVEPTSWSFLCVFFLALLIGTGKRMAEGAILADPRIHREVLEGYSVEYLRIMALLAATSSILTYALFSIVSGKNQNLIYSIPFVVYGILRYVWLIENRKGGDEPEIFILRDPPLLVNGLLWFLVVLSILYIWP